MMLGFSGLEGHLLKCVDLFHIIPVNRSRSEDGIHWCYGLNVSLETQVLETYSLTQQCWKWDLLGGV
jgi:hypothetical protein